ncbi:MAG: hypothetical protein IPK26_13945 [Planctomycetes bacterium]|nr:hypothetical protein [Planctomycetota bacterium]
MLTPLSSLVPTLAGPQQPAGSGAPTEGIAHVDETFRFLAAPPLWVIALIVIPGAAVWAWWSYGGLQRLETRIRWTLTVIRALAILFCCLLVFQPVWETVIYRKTQNQVHVLVDDSASMQRKDSYPDQDQASALQTVAGPGELAGRTRGELVQAVLERQGGLLEQLAKTHEVRLFRAPRKPVPIRSLSELTLRANRTHLGDALDLHLGAVGGINLDAVILVSDGRNNAGVDPVEMAAKYGVRGIPIHTIGVGDPEPPHNAWIVGPPGPKEALREEQVAFDVSLRAEGLAGKPARVELQGSRDGGPFAPLTAAQAELPADGDVTRVRLYHAFPLAGDWTLRFSVASQPDESQVDDNQDTRFLRVNDERIRVLYVEERPRWEYRYIKTALKRVDPSIQMQAVLFEASPAFIQEHSDDLPPLRDIPRTEKELLQYHVILLGDVHPERLGATEEEIRRWLEMVVKFVEFGGGAGFLFGAEAMPERYRGTPLADLLPVVLEDPVALAGMPRKWDSEFRALLENPLQPHDILLLQRDVAFNRKLWEQGLPGFRAWYPLARAKPGATVLLRHPTEENRYGKRPIAVVSPHPRGNTFFIATDETWIWRDTYAELYMDAFWRNVVRHLATGKLQRRSDLLELTLDKTLVETGDKVRLLLRVHDEELQPSTAAEYPVFLRDAAGKTERRTLRATPGDPGAFTAAFTMPDPGAFSFLVFANGNPADAVLAREDLLVQIPDKEMAESSQDAEMLQRIAEASSGADARGRHVFLAQADELAADFAQRRPFEQREETRTRPAWDTSWSLAILLAALAIEWILRKRARLV